jgi:hypothetical protein
MLAPPPTAIGEVVVELARLCAPETASVRQYLMHQPALSSFELWLLLVIW